MQLKIRSINQVMMWKCITYFKYIRLQKALSAPHDTSQAVHDCEPWWKSVRLYMIVKTSNQNLYVHV